MKTSALRRHPSIKPTGRGVTLSALHPAYRSGRSMFPSRVYDPDEVKQVLKTGDQSRKIGKVVQKGRWRGFPIFTLTLEERATCPRTCKAWGQCYGNGMQAAERIVAGAPLEQALWAELEAKQAAHPAGFAVRLHVLGDFYSAEYVDLWKRALATFPALHVFGFTARDPEKDPIGRALHRLVITHWHRFAIRYSGVDAREGGSVVIERGEATPHVVCPAQTGGTDCCATCALCWHSDRTIAFWRH